MKRLLLATASVALTAAPPAFAQSMGSMPGMQMPGMTMPAKPKPKASKRAPAKKPKPAAKSRARSKSAKPAEAAAPSGHQGHDMSAMPGMTMPMPAGNAQDGNDMQSMPGMDTGTMQTSGQPVGTDLPAGNAPAPPPPSDHAADRTYSPAAMARAREEMMTEQGGQNFHQVLFNLAEIQVRNGRDGYRWDGEAWFGGDINRLVVKSEGEGTIHEGVDSAEVQALYSRAIGPYFNLQAGVRHDFQPSPTRTYATVGVEGLAPYMFDTEAALFLSTKGDVLGRVEGWYDQRITQRLVLQPRVELNLAAQDVPEDRIGAGLTDAELGLRLRYEIRREFAPYAGISYEAKTGRTADFARAAGEDPSGTSFVAGIRFWF